MNKCLNFTYNNRDLVLYYNNDYFKITTDNLYLAKFVKIRKKDSLLVELGCGLGVIPLFISTVSSIKIIGIEKEKTAAILALKSIKDNKLDKQIKIVNDDIKNMKKYFNINSIDIIVANPPYFLLDKDYLVSSNLKKQVARHEVTMSFSDVISLAKVYLKDGGNLFLIQRVERLFEVKDLLFSNSFAIKRIQFIHHNKTKGAKLCLIEASKGASWHGVKVMEPIFLKEEEE